MGWGWKKKEEASLKIKSEKKRDDRKKEGNGGSPRDV
jgi:hypothetical protein